MKIAIIYGGVSSEREISIKTAKEIMKNLDKDKYEIIDLRIDKKSDVLKLKDMDVDFVYVGLHGKFGEDGNVQAILESMNLPYSGPGVLTSAVCMDKDTTKRVVASYGVRVPKGWSIRKGEKAYFPEGVDEVVIKPNSGGSSVCTSFVKSVEEVEEALKGIFEIDDEALMEEVIRGEEISVPIISGKVYPIVKIEALKGEFFDYKSKYEQGGAKEYVCNFEPKLQNEIEELTKKAYYAVKCKSFCRVDFIIRNGVPYMIEINTLPGMTAASLLPKSLASVGIDYKGVIDLLINASLRGGNEEIN